MQTLQTEYPKGQKEKKILKRTKPQEATSTEKKSSEDQPRILAPVNLFKLINYKKILEAHLIAADEHDTSNKVGQDDQEKFTARNMRCLIHIDTLNTLVMNALASGHQEWTLQMLEDYYVRFIEAYHDRGTVSWYFLKDIPSHSLYLELRIDDFIANLPFYDVNRRIIVNNCYLDINSLRDTLSVLISSDLWYDSVDKYDEIMNKMNNMNNMYIPNGMLEMFNITNYHMNLIAHEEVNNEDDEHDVV